MKIIFTLAVTLLLSISSFNTSTPNSDRNPASVRTPQQAHSCKYTSGDIKTVVGYGADIHKARSAASKLCFEKRIDLYETTRNAFPSTAQGQLIIDSCVNIKCN